MRRRAIGITRVSQVGEREGERFASPDVQEDRLRATCEREGIDLIRILPEMDVSGGLPLEERPGLGPAIAAIEAGEAEVLAGAYFDRLFRNLREQADAVQRVEAVRGEVLTVDFGRVTENGSAAQWLSGTMLGAVSEYFKRSAKERSGAAVQRAINRGVPPWPNVTPGFVRGEDGRFRPDTPERVQAVVDALTLRADGQSVANVRDHLRANGYPAISYHGTQTLLCSRVLRGEIHFGGYEPNLNAHDHIVEEDLWQAVQRAKVSRGRRAKSDRLLARLKVLRCATCDGFMVVGSAHHGEYPLYRCSPTGDCPRRVTISAEVVERAVETAVRKAIADEQGRASMQQNARDAESALARSQAELDALIAILDPLEPAARVRLEAATAKRNADRERVEQLRGTSASITVHPATDWDRLNLAERRALIRATIERATVAPGRGAGRVAVKLFGE
ncbi:recombinase family protein [Solirubrobacter taibaiensis]|nr:recombinase family protein [Solirubrobacter taibaiensis]